MSLSAQIKIFANAVKTKIADFEAASSSIGLSHSIALTDGVGDSQVDVSYKDTITLSASATVDLDLSGSLTDIYGAAQVFARLKTFVVTADAANTNNVNVTRPANGVPWALASGDGVPVAPGEAKVLVNRSDVTGITVTAGTGDLITFTNSSGSTSVTFSVLLIGASA